MSIETATIVTVLLVLVLWLRSNRTKTKVIVNTPLQRTSVKNTSSVSSPSTNSKSVNEKEEKAESEAYPLEFNKDDETKLASLQLIEYEENENLLKLKATLEAMAKPHPELMALLQPISEPKELYKLISKDLQLVGRVLEVTNSAYYGLDKPIDNLHHAVMYLGLIQVRSIATNFALRESVSFSSVKQQTAYEKIWKTAFVASEIARILIRELRLKNAGGLATSCQLSYLGDIAFIMTHKSASGFYLNGTSIIDRIRTAQDSLSTNQSNLAMLMGHSWNLPEDLTDSIERKYWPLTNNFDELASIEEKQQTMVFYISCMLAEKLVFEQDKFILRRKSFSYQDNGAIEFYYTSEHLEKASLTRINQVVFEPGFQRKMQELLG